MEIIETIKYLCLLYYLFILNDIIELCEFLNILYSKCLMHDRVVYTHIFCHTCAKNDRNSRMNGLIKGKLLGNIYS